MLFDKAIPQSVDVSDVLLVGLACDIEQAVEVCLRRSK